MPEPQLSPRTAKILPWLVASAFFMQMLDATILNTALPAIAGSLNESPLRMQAVVVAYLLTVAITIPASGWLSERFGSKRIFLLAIILFSLGSLLCALSLSLYFMVFARFVQGLGGAMLVPVGRLVIMQAYPRAQLVRLLSFIVMPGLIGPLVGPVVGGVLVQYISWHWIFLINLPIGLLGFIATLHCMPDFRRASLPAFDWLGYIMFSVVMLCISLAIGGLGELRMPHMQVLLLMVGGLAMLTAYWLYALRHENPLFSPGLFKIRSFSVGIMGNLFSRLGTGALPFLHTLMLQLGLGYSPLEAGLMMAPVAMAAIICKPLINPLLRHFSYRSVLLCATVAGGALVCCMFWVDHNTPIPLVLALLGLIGGVNSLQFTAMNTLTLIGLPDSLTAQGNGMLAVIMQLAASLAVGAAAALLAGFGGDEAAGLLVLDAFHATYLCVGGITVMAGLIYLQLDKNDGRVPPDDGTPVPGH